MTITTYRTSVVLRMLVALGSLALAAVTHAQNVTVTAANASNDAIYDVNFPPSGTGGSITVLNTDGGSLHHIVSLVFLPNPGSFALDLLAADNQGGLIVRYPGDFHSGDPTTGTPIPLNGTGPAYPDGLSVDSVGDLYVVNSAPGNGASNPQLWVLPSDGMGNFTTPQLIDALPGFTSAYSTYVSTETLADTLVATTTIAPPNGNPSVCPGGAPGVVCPGDVLVVTSNPSQVLRYAATNGPIPAAPTVLVTLPAGSIPGGLAFWPADNSLLVSTSRGTIYQYNLTSGASTTFATGLGNGQFKVRTGVQSGVPYAYVANNNGGDILEFTGPNQLVATVTSGVQHPQGIAVTNSTYALLNTCQNQQNNGCDPFGGGIITPNVPPNLNVFGNIAGDICLVEDPRPANGGGSLSISQVCGFDTKATIPASLHGASGSTGKAFAVIRFLTQAEHTPGAPPPFNGDLIAVDSNLPNIFPVLPPPAPQNPVCTPGGLGAIAWAPLPGEGDLVVENNGVVVPSTDLVELTSKCDGSGGRYAGLSFFVVGVAVNTTNLRTYTASKYADLLATIQDEITPVDGSPSALQAPTLPSVQPPDGDFTYQLQQCIATSQAAFGRGSSFDSGTANELLAADQQVANVAALSPPFTAVTDYPNPSGALRQRLQNIYFTIDSRINLNALVAGPPPPPTISGVPPSGTVNTPYTFKPTADDFTGHNDGTLTYSVAGLPSWAAFNAMTGVLSGTPTVKGTFGGIVITVTDGCASAQLGPLTIVVNAAPAKHKGGGGGGDDDD